MLPTSRTSPAGVADEATMLKAYLDRQRDTLRWKTDGLTQAQLAQTLHPTTMTLAGLLKHMALVDSAWILLDFAGRTLPAPAVAVDWDTDPEWEWRAADHDTPEYLRALFDEAVALSDEVLVPALADGVDQRAAGPESTDSPLSLRWILLHLIEEYARHNGHADLLRESIDGQTGD